MKSILLLLMIVLVGCVSKSEKQPVTRAIQPSEIASELRVTEFPATARTIEPFQKITPDMSMQDVVQLCGLPDNEIGSGLHIFVYNLSDSSTVLVGTGDLKHLIYVTHGNERLIGK